MNLRTHEEFMKEMKEAHWCEKCDGKIFCISLDYLGNTCCGYCGVQVNYPKATKYELAFWITMKEDKKLFEELAKS